MDRGVVLFITGIPSSGKTTLANNLARLLRDKGIPVEAIDAYIVRHDILGYGDTEFTGESRRRILYTLAWIAKLLARHGVIVIISGVFPEKATRIELKKIIGGDARVVTIYLKCRPEICSKRDYKGLYERFYRGEIDRLPGLNPPYEEPDDPDIVVNVEDMGPVEVLNYVYKRLMELGVLNK